jgi:hypothetical protein
VSRSRTLRLRFPPQAHFRDHARGWINQRRLLDDLGMHALVIVGAVRPLSALDAYIRGFTLWVPADASASTTRERNARAMQFLGESPGCDISPASRAEPARFA